MDAEGLACGIEDTMNERTKFEGHQIICTNLPHYPWLDLIDSTKAGGAAPFGTAHNSVAATAVSEPRQFSDRKNKMRSNAKLYPWFNARATVNGFIAAIDKASGIGSLEQILTTAKSFVVSSLLVSS